MGKPLAIDLFCGLGGWAEGLIAEGWRVVGFDIERHEYGAHRYPAQLVIQDVLTLHGSQFRDAALIVASPPCQEYSYMAMPWKRAKAKAAAIRADETGRMLADLNRLFDACFRIQAEASLAAGRHIPMVVENVRGAIPWGRALALELRQLPPVGRRAGADAVCRRRAAQGRRPVQAIPRCVGRLPRQQNGRLDESPRLPLRRQRPVVPVGLGRGREEQRC